MTNWYQGYFTELYAPTIYGNANGPASLMLISSQSLGLASITIGDGGGIGSVNIIGNIQTTGGMPTSDPADGTGTLWYDSLTNIVYRGT